MADYDIGEAFREIEHELLSSMTRNLTNHKVEELTEGFEWAQWQVMQLEALEEYRRKNAAKFPKEFSEINDRIEENIRTSYNDAQTAQEREILKWIHKRTPGENTPYNGAQTIQGEFFKTNDRKLDALVNATKKDMQKAEYAVLRLTNDKYRQIIFNAQVYVNTGAATYEKAVDMACRDFLNAGINCIEYKNGRLVPIDVYAEMALRTANKRAYLQGDGEMRQKWGIHTVIMNKRTNACPKCAKFAGKVIVDDVWSGGTADEAVRKGYLLMSECIKEGLYHPNCQDVHTTYFGDVLKEEEELERRETEQSGDQAETQQSITPRQDDELLQGYTEEEQERNIELYNAEQRENHCERQIQRFERLSEFSLDRDNKQMYEARKNEWKGRLVEIRNQIKDIKIENEKIYHETAIPARAAEAAAVKEISDEVQKDVAIAAGSGIIESVLTEDEKAALNAYISSESYTINEKLRSGITLTDEEKWIVDNLDSALGKLPKYKGTVYRSLDSSMMGNLVEFWIFHQPGNIVGYKAFTSTSLKTYDDRMDIQYVITSKSGRNITSFNPNEEEILFERDTLFRVVKIDGNTIYLKEW